MSQRFAELSERFMALEPQLPQGPEREALSVLFAMTQEAWRQQGQTSPSEGGLEWLRNLYKSAPKMEAAAVNPGLPVGSPAPDFSLPNAQGEHVRLSDFRGRPVVLVFYPLDWSPGCSQQLDLYQSELAEFERRGAQILGISVDSIYSHGAWAAVRRIAFPLLSDFHPKGEVARRYQVFRENDGFSERALYVVDGSGMIRYAHVSPYLHHVPPIEELFAALDALRR
ncbi:peroxiredoxin [Allomeiothermus silvanus]|uniref:peroxiredoxin n=1 Tax=Allomeiothermus silvanus TaxID=52022 RepID=UPI002356D7D2|nr:peroxiredoxin [Allomeiothermus silvanus]MBI5812456.1 peroxiredoxin [Allomeiothermus silvanus]